MHPCEGICPSCGVIAIWQFTHIAHTLPPTGGDYEWSEGPAIATCPACQSAIPVRVRIDLDTGAMQLIESPLPTHSCAVVATITRFSTTLINIQVLAIAADLPTAEQLLHARGGPRSEWGGPRRRALLLLSAAGFAEPNGQPIPDGPRALQYAPER
ncbi:MAG: hypothetical protein Fur005_46620 [Roseiflexaceae bacterium]